MRKTLNDWVLVKPIDEGKKNPLSHLGVDFEMIPMKQDEWRYQPSKAVVMCDSKLGFMEGDVVHYDYIANGTCQIEGGELINGKTIRSFERKGELRMAGTNIYVEKLPEPQKSTTIILLSVEEKPSTWVKILHVNMDETTRGNFVWENESSKTKVDWEQNENGSIKFFKNSEGLFPGMEVLVNSDFLIPETINGKAMFRAMIEDILGIKII